MFRIDDATAATSIPTPETAGTEGYFTEGNPATGTPATKVRGSWLNMIQEELRAIVVAAGLTPSKTTYTQVRDAIAQMYSPGRYLGTQVFTSSGTYTPGTYTVGGRSVVAGRARIRGIGGGGAGGGTTATGAGAACVGLGGSAGSFGEVLQVGLSSQTVTIGAAGAPASNANGGAGGTTSIGSWLVCPGGPGGLGGGNTGPTSGPIIFATQVGAAAATSTASGIVFLSKGWLAAAYAYILSATNIYSGQGANSPYGSGGGPQSSTNIGGVASGYGAGGGGSSALASSAAQAGGSGAPGIIIIDEYA